MRTDHMHANPISCSHLRRALRHAIGTLVARQMARAGHQAPLLACNVSAPKTRFARSALMGNALGKIERQRQELGSGEFVKFEYA